MKKDGKRKKVWRVVRRTLLVLFVAAAAFVLFFAVEVFDMDEWHEFDVTRIKDAPRTCQIYDATGEEVSCLYRKEDRRWVSIADIPLHVQRAFISAEDARFYEHGAIDVIRIIGAALHDIRTGSFAQGASTISQQLIKLSHLTGENAPAEKTISRKVEEAVLAYKMETIYSKDEILEMYLNYVYFGGGYYGVESAAQGYFGVHASELTTAQGAMLAGILKSPSKYAPHINMEKSIGRRGVVLDLMCEYGYISAEECEEAKKEEVTLTGDSKRGYRNYYIDMVLNESCDALNIDMATLLSGGYSVYTAMDSGLQNECEAVCRDNGLYPVEGVQTAIVVADAKTAMAVAVMGGREYKGAFGFNRATDIRRQPGSVIKPIISYAPALEYFGYTAASMILDEPTEFDKYCPGNAGGKYYGWVTLREAVKKSLNVPAVKVLAQMGVESGKLFASRLGIEFDSKDKGLALALGGFTYGVSPWQLTAAYGCFASGGMYSELNTVARIEDKYGNTVYEREYKPIRVMSEENAYILTSMLESAVSEGTGKRLSQLGIPLAGKTGTVGDSSKTRDAWMTAYNSNYVATVWMGYDKNSDGMYLPSDATGGHYPAMVLAKIYEFLYRDNEPPQFNLPRGVREVRLDGYALSNNHSVLLATALTPNDMVFREVFREGTEPTERSGYWSVPLPIEDITAAFNENGLPCISFRPRESHIKYRLIRRDSYGSEVLIGEWSGETQLVQYVDISVEYGMTYVYRVQPIHPQITIGGKAVEGVPSNEVTVIMPGSYIPVDGKAG